MVREAKTKQLGKNRLILKPSWAFVETKNINLYAELPNPIPSKLNKV